LPRRWRGWRRTSRGNASAGARWAIGSEGGRAREPSPTAHDAPPALDGDDGAGSTECALPAAAGMDGLDLAEERVADLRGGRAERAAGVAGKPGPTPAALGDLSRRAGGGAVRDLPPEHALALPGERDRDGVLERRGGLRLRAAGVPRQERALPVDDFDDGAAGAGDHDPRLCHVSRLRVVRDLPAADAPRLLRRAVLHLPVDAVLPPAAERTVGGRPRRRRERVGDLLADAPAALPAGAGDLRAVPVPGHLERLPRPADLHQRSQSLH